MQPLALDALPVTLPLPGGSSAVLTAKAGAGTTTLTIRLPYRGAYGMGEKFNRFNQKGLVCQNVVEEKFCYQGEKTYCPAPFFCTDSGFGLLVDTDEVTTFDFTGNAITVLLPGGAPVFAGTGTPAELVRAYMQHFGPAPVPPKWAFGPWISANRWNTQKQVEQQLALLKTHGYPATVLVVEAWSDEATFYTWNGARYTPRPNGGALRYEDFDFSESAHWQDPRGMIDKLHDAGVHLVLWQIPVYKKQSDDEPPCPQNDLDREDAVRRGLCVKNADGTPYTIPPGHWFPGSMIPDFTNPVTRQSWFAKRQYLLDMGVDGFKTDGGEFIYSDDVQCYDGSTGRAQKNRYAQSYTSAYSAFLGSDKVLFSRAGYAGQHTSPCLWAGDQQSTNDELRSVLHAGLSAAMSGIVFWGFDIAGFAGPLPTPDLYRRATMMACFAPIMQWHSEPDGGQFKELMAGAAGDNERSPWNLATAFNAPGLTEELRFWHRLRMNLLPYLYSTALHCAATSTPMLRPLVYGWADDATAAVCDDEFLLGDSLLVAPLLAENATGRKVYLPSGQWYSLFTHEHTQGGQTVTATLPGKLPVWVRGGCGLALHLAPGGGLGSDVGNAVHTTDPLHFVFAGEKGSYTFCDESGATLHFAWQNGTLRTQPAGTAFTCEFLV